MTAALSERFWAKVERRAPDECWPWLATRNSDGYGNIRADKHGPLLKAHRVAYELSNGPIPPNISVLHRCDNPTCCNPGHLFLGTQQDNMVDRDAKGRGRTSRNQGASNPGSKLSEAQVIEIRTAPGTQREIARRFGIAQQQVSKIKRGQKWASL